ncbi:hypothetical protein MMC25_006113 [Agyrium rufum]|nr:hypothetical protein [Agyrium rufum]
MSNFFSNMRQGFGRQTNTRSGPAGTSTGQPGGQRNGSTPTTPSTPFSPTLTESGGATNNQVYNSSQESTEMELPLPEGPRFFFQSRYARLGVRGNFMPLAAQPPNVDLGEWLAHHAVDQYRLIEQLVLVVQEVDNNTGLSICNRNHCSTMTAGVGHTYTWLNSKKEPVKVAAPQYTSLVQRWIVSKVSDTTYFPTDTNMTLPMGVTPFPPSTDFGGSGGGNATSPIPAGPSNLSASLAELAGRNWVGKAAGFPENFFHDVKTIFRQLFRLYAHLYHSHWVEPFWHLSDGVNGHGWMDLNSCFVHFVSVAMLFGLLGKKDMEPMQPLIDIWVGNGSVPADCANGACTITTAQG